MASAEQKKSYKVVKQFAGLNTKANRTAIKEEEFSWIENVQPVGYGNLKVLATSTLITDNTGNVVVWSSVPTYTNFVNLNLINYVVTFQANGGAEYFDDINNIKGTIAPSGFFSSSGVTVTQWENQYMLILDPNQGYYYWDGTNLPIFIGSVGAIGLVSGGSNYTSAPTVTISAPNDANGVQATAVCTISTNAGGVVGFNITAIGSGYTSVPIVTIAAPNLSNGVQATASATIQSGGIVALSVTNIGSGYTSQPSVSITGGGGSGATANAVVSMGQVSSVSLTNAGTGYTQAPTITFSGGGGSGANAIAQINTFAVGAMAVSVTNGGSGYSSEPTITISGGGGTGANAVAILSADTITQVIMVNTGSGYTNTANITVTVSGGGGNGAVLTPVVNTDQNTSIATFSGRVWLSQGRTIFYTTPLSISDFTSLSSGSEVISDSTLIKNVNALVSANNFLYIFGETSINVFSDVLVQSNGTTVFTNTNISASIGTKRPNTIFPYFRSIMFMNDYGIYALVGSTTTKLSDALDGVFNNIDFTNPVYGGQVVINNILCAAFNFRYFDAVFTNSYRFIQAVFFEKKWFITSQGDSINMFASLPDQGKINIYGISGNNLYELYSNTTANVSTILQTALFPMDDPIRTKQALKFGVEATLTQGASFDVTVDSEYGSSPVVVLANLIPWVNNSGTIVPWMNTSSNVIGWNYSNGYALYKNDAQQWGKYVGLTMTSSSPQFTVNTFEFEHELRTRF
jgi:hypothetical protein